MIQIYNFSSSFYGVAPEIPGDWWVEKRSARARFMLMEHRSPQNYERATIK